MRLDPRALGLAGSTVAGLVILFCALVVAVTPAGSTFGGMAMHRGMSGMGGMGGMGGAAGMGSSMAWGGFLLWLVLWVVGTGLALAALAALYNRFLGSSAAGGRA